MRRNLIRLYGLLVIASANWYQLKETYLDGKFYKFTIVESHGSSRVLRPKIVVSDAENGPKFNLYYLWQQTVMAATQTSVITT